MTPLEKLAALCERLNSDVAYDASYWAEEITAAVWDMPSLETREEFNGALFQALRFLLPLQARSLVPLLLDMLSELGERHRECIDRTPVPDGVWCSLHGILNVRHCASCGVLGWPCPERALAERISKAVGKVLK
jgi:hypothetical protein